VKLAKKRTEKEIELENGGPGVYNIDLKKNYLLLNDEWKYDIIPEIMDGKNIADFVDPDIDAKLAVLEAEEDELQKKAEMEDSKGGMNDDEEEDVVSDLDEEEKETVQKIKLKKKMIYHASMLTRTNNKPQIPRKFRVRKLEKAEEKLQELGLDTTKFRSSSKQRMKKRSRDDNEMKVADPSSAASSSSSSTISSDRGRSRKRESSRPRSASAPRTESQAAALRSRSRSLSRARSQTPKPGEGYRSVKQKTHAEKLSKKSHRVRNLDARMGEADRHVYDLKPKHLFSGKRGIGKTDRR